MRRLALLTAVVLIACEPRVIITPSRSPQVQPSATASGATPSPTASTAPPKIALRPVPTVTPPTRLISYARASDIPQPPAIRFVLTDDGRVITEDGTSGELTQRRMTPTGAATLTLQAIQTGLFDKDAEYPRVPVPGTTPPGRGPTVFIVAVANAGRDVKVVFEPSGQPDDEQYQRSATRDKLTALVRGYEDLSSIPANQWAESRPQPYQPAFHRLFVLPQTNVTPPGRPHDADDAWPFLTPIPNIGAPIGGAVAGGGTWRCAILIDEDALALGEALARAGAITRYAWGSPIAVAELAWRGGGSARLQITPLLPYEPATCAGAVPPL